jgi:hypothetical protein
MADYLVEKTLGKKNEIYVKKLEGAICDLKHAFNILSIQVFKGGALRRGGGGRPGEAK